MANVNSIQQVFMNCTYVLNSVVGVRDINISKVGTYQHELTTNHSSGLSEQIDLLHLTLNTEKSENQ